MAERVEIQMALPQDQQKGFRRQNGVEVPAGAEGAAAVIPSPKFVQVADK